MVSANIVAPITETITGEALTWIVMIYLIALLIVQVLSAAVGKSSKLQRLGRYLSVGTVPLLFVFLLKMALRGLEAFS